MRRHLSISATAGALALAAAMFFPASAQAQQTDHPGVPPIASISTGSPGTGAAVLVAYSASQPYAIQYVACGSTTDTQTYLVGFVSIPDSQKFGRSSAKASQKDYATMIAQLGDGAGGVTTSFGPGGVAGCSISWSLKDDDKDGDYDGGTDEMKGTLQCDKEGLVAAGLSEGTVDAIAAQLDGKLGCTMKGIPAPAPFPPF